MQFDNAHRRLKYRGRLDEGRTSPPPPGARRELFEAMRAIAATGEAPPRAGAIDRLFHQVEGSRVRRSPRGTE